MTDPVDQFKSFLTLKVREQIVNFQTLNRENNVDALPLLLDNILRTLQEGGIDLENIEAPPRKLEESTEASSPTTIGIHQEPLRQAPDKTDS